MEESTKLVDESTEALWYVVHTYSGYENKVANDLQTMVENRHLQELICDIKVPVEMVPEIDKNGKQKMVEHKLFPGYVLVKMVMNDDTWYVCLLYTSQNFLWLCPLGVSSRGFLNFSIAFLFLRAPRAEVDLMSPCSIARRRARKKGLTSARGAGMVKKRRRIAMLYPFSALLARMKYITRWSLMHSTRAESLSEHTCDTALLAHLLCLIAKHYTGTPCRPEVVAVAALYHDAPEIITGDMPTPVKYHSPALRDAYKALETESVRSMAALLPAELAAELTPCMDGSVLTAEEHRLLKAADRLSALIKCTEEQRSGNHEFDAALTQQRAALQAMHCPEADWFLEHCLPCYTQNLDELTKA